MELTSGPTSVEVEQESNPWIVQAQGLVIEHRVPDWAHKREEKFKTLCEIICVTCGAPCFAEHQKEDQCPPCSEYVPWYSFQLKQTHFKGKNEPVELSMATARGTTRLKHTIRPWSFDLHGQPCNMIVIVDSGDGDHTCSQVPYAMWRSDSVSLLKWELDKLGFEDSAIVNTYSRLHETTMDVIESNLLECGPDFYGDTSMEEVSPACNVVVILSWGGRVKVAGDWTLIEVVMAGNNELVPPLFYDVMCYGEPHGKVMIRESKLSRGQVFMMVPRSFDSAWISSRIRADEDVDNAAEALIGFGLDVTWAVKIN